MNINFWILNSNVGDWFTRFWKDLRHEVMELFEDIFDFFILIKENTYDVLCANYGTEIVNLLGLGLIFLIVMIVAMKIINR